MSISAIMPDVVWIYSRAGACGVLVLSGSAGVLAAVTVCASVPAAADGSETALL